jgi:hypothetical protein
MYLNLTAEKAAEWAAVRYFPMPHIEQGKYNALVWGFNASTVLLVIAVANAVFSAAAAAVIIGAAALLIRYVTENALNKYKMPVDAHKDIANFFAKFMSPPVEREVIAQKTHARLPDDWEVDYVAAFEFSLWKNPIPN